MLFKKYFLFLLVFVSIFRSYSQQNSLIEIDTLANRNYDELKKIFYAFKNSGEIKAAEKVAYYILGKAKKDNNEKAIANSYIYLSRVSHKNPKVALKYIDSSITISTRSRYPKLQADAHFFKAKAYFALQEFEKSLIHYVKAKKYYTKKKDKSTYYAIHNNIGLIKQRVNEHEEALQIFIEC